jgi:hypothetical protein
MILWLPIPSALGEDGSLGPREFKHCSEEEEAMSIRFAYFMLTLLLAPLSAQAAEMAKQGEDSYTTTYIVSASKTLKLGDRTITTLQFGGITRNDKGTGMFNNMGTECLGTRESLGTEVTSRGACVDMDQDGDQVFTTYEAKGSSGAPTAGTHVFVGGTGKYSGISGKADYTVQGVKAPEGTTMFIVPHKATWILK